MFIELGTLVTLIGAILAAASWIVSRLEKIATEIATLRIEAKDYVTHEACHRRRQECPCISAIDDLEKEIKGMRQSAD